MSVFNKEDIRLWAVMFANRLRFTAPIYDYESIEYGFKKGFEFALKKMQANESSDNHKQALPINSVMPSFCPICSCKIEEVQKDIYGCVNEKCGEMYEYKIMPNTNKQLTLIVNWA